MSNIISKIVVPSTTEATGYALYNIKDSNAIHSSEKGAANGVAELDENGKVPSSQLPAHAEGEVSSIKIGTTEYNPEDGIVTLPEYPTTLPASDVHDWAKAVSKPSYTKSEVGLGNVGNFLAVSTEASQGLSETQKTNARSNIGAGTSSFSGSYNDLTDKPTIPSVGNAEIEIQKNGTKVGSFTTNQSGSKVAVNITVPTGTAANKDVPTSGNASTSQVVMGDDSRLTDSRNAKDVYSWAKASSKPTYTASEVGAIPTSAKGAASGVATLDSAGKVPSSQLPSYVDDVLDYDTKSDFPTTGEAGKIYVDKSTNTSWRWSGSAYTQIKGDLAIGTTTGTAADGGTASAHYSNTSNPHSVTKAQVGLGSVVNTGDSATPVSGGTTKFTTGGAYTELAKKVDKVSGKGLSTNDYTTDEKNKLAGIAAGAEVNVQSDWNATSGDAMILNKPTIPAAVTESTVSGWGFTKNAGTITGIKMNGASKGTSGVVDLGTVITAHQDISGKVDNTTTVNGHALSGNVSVTKSDIGLGNVGNFKAVSTVASQGLSDTEKSNARANIGAGTSSFSGSYNDLSNKPTIPTVNNAKFSIKGAGTEVASTTANASSASSVDIVAGSNVTVTPDATNKKITIAATDTTYSAATTSAAGLMSADDKTKLNGIATGATKVTTDTVSGWGYTKNAGTVTGVKMNGTTKSPSSGVVDLGTVITSHQDISGKVNTTTTVNGHALSSNVTVTKSDVSLGNVTNDAQVKRSEMGAASGVATLDSSGKVPSSQLPSYVDDVIEGYFYNSKFYKESAHTTEITGETGKIYVDLSTNKTYRWGGSAYVVISETLALGETSSTAYRGDKGKTAYTHSQTTSGNPHNVTKSDVGLGNVGNFKAVSTVASQGLTDTEKSNARANIGAGTSSFSGSYNDLSNKPTIPSAANNGTFSVKTKVGSNAAVTAADFTANQSSADDVTFVQGTNVTLTTDTTNRTITIAAKDTTYSAATQSANGLMSSTDKTKLDGIATGATKVTTDTVSGWGYTKNTGTVTSVKVNGTIKSPSSGTVDIGTVLTSHQSVTDSNPTLSWGTKSKVATIGSTAINVTMPSNPNTDKNVKVNTTNPSPLTTYYPVWYSAASGTGELNANDGFKYTTLEGTTTDLGCAAITLGNYKGVGNAGNKYGIFNRSGSRCSDK